MKPFTNLISISRYDSSIVEDLTVNLMVGWRLFIYIYTVEPRYSVLHWENEKSLLYQIEVLYKSNINGTSSHHHGLEGGDPQMYKGLFMGQLAFINCYPPLLQGLG